MQGGPLMHTIAAKADLLPDRRDGARSATTSAQVRANADALAAGLIDGGFDVLTGGTDTHLVQLDLRATEWTGLAAQERLEECRLTANRNTVPFDERPPMVASGVRLGTPAATMRGFDEDDFREVASIIVGALQDGRRRRRRCARRALALCDKRPLYPGFRGYTLRVRLLDAGRRGQAPAGPYRASYLRDKDTPTVHFRRLVEEVTLLLTHQATMDLPTDHVEIETPLEHMSAPHLARRCALPISGVGLGMLDGALTLISGVRVGFIGLYRDEETLYPVETTSEAAAGRRRPRGDPARPDARHRQLDGARIPSSSKTPVRSSVRLLAIIAAPEGIENIERQPSRRADRRSPRSTAS